MARYSTASDAWAKSDAVLETAVCSTRVNVTARDCFDEYQDKRAIEGALATSLFYNDTECAKTPALGVDSMVSAAEYAATWINPPMCHRVSAADLGWERREQEFGSSRGANNVMGPAADKFLEDPALGWSDVLDVKGAGGAMPMRLASGVSMTSTKAFSAVPAKMAVDANMRRVSATPSASAMSPSIAAMEREYAAMFERSKVGGSAVAHGIVPGAATR